MRSSLFLYLVTFIPNSFANDSQIPSEVSDYLHERSLCEHFRGEPHEGNSPEQIERRKFIFESLEIYCAGADRRLAALKRRYKDNAIVNEKLNAFEEQIESHDKCP